MYGLNRLNHSHCPKHGAIETPLSLLLLPALPLLPYIYCWRREHQALPLGWTPAPKTIPAHCIFVFVISSAPGLRCPIGKGAGGCFPALITAQNPARVHRDVLGVDKVRSSGRTQLTCGSPAHTHFGALGIRELRAEE